MKKDARPGSPFSLRVSEVQPEAAQREKAFGPGTAGLNALLLSSEQLSGPWPAILEKIRDQIHAATATPAPADFNLAPDGSRPVFPLNQVTGITWKQVSVDPPSFNTDSVNVGLLGIIPGAVGHLAYGKFVSPDYEVHPGEYIPQVGTLTGTPAVQDMNEIYFDLVLPSGQKPPGGGQWRFSATGLHFPRTAFLPYPTWQP